MLDQTKAYDRIHPEYLYKVLNRFGFPNKFIKCIHDLFFGNSISVNVNGSLSDSIQQLRGLRQGDSISPILFNLAIEPFLLSILHNEIIDGYCLKARRSNSDLQLTAPRPVKLLAYADDILIFINSKEEFLELQERLKVYNGASNSQVNYSKSVAFPLAGGTTFNNRELKELIIHNGLRWFDSQSLGYIKYFGYPIWFTNDQRTIFYKETIRKLENSVNIHSQRQLSVYGRAHIANTLILSKLWHFLRITSLPKSFYNKVSSIAYQFVAHNLFPRIARTTLEQPKNKGGVSLLNVEVQQKVFQFRYINPLLALDSCPRLPTENDLTISSQTSLLIPFKDICEEDPQEKFKFSKFLQAQKAYHFFEQDFLSNGIQFKSRQHCGSPNILQKIKNAVLTGNLIFKPYFASLLSAEQQDLELDNEEHPTEPNINFDPFIQQMSYEDINITTLKNRQLKTMFRFNSNTQITNISHNNWKAFISSPMYHIPRNVWYRLLQ
ncbi:hypothetical protein G6F48_012568 [Rhizopus delemar]|nr:hypothetical protein G6F48_012568 [Rhizopus delemar]